MAPAHKKSLEKFFGQTVFDRPPLLYGPREKYFLRAKIMVAAHRQSRLGPNVSATAARPPCGLPSSGGRCRAPARASRSRPELRRRGGWRPRRRHPPPRPRSPRPGMGCATPKVAPRPEAKTHPPHTSDPSHAPTGTPQPTQTRNLGTRSPRRTIARSGKDLHPRSRRAARAHARKSASDPRSRPPPSPRPRSLRHPTTNPIHRMTNDLTHRRSSSTCPSPCGPWLSVPPRFVSVHGQWPHALPAQAKSVKNRPPPRGHQKLANRLFTGCSPCAEAACVRKQTTGRQQDHLCAASVPLQSAREFRR